MEADTPGTRINFTRLLASLYAVAAAWVAVYSWNAGWGLLSNILGVTMAVVAVAALDSTFFPRRYPLLRAAAIVHAVLGCLLFLPFLRDTMAAHDAYPTVMAVFVLLNISTPTFVVIRVWHHLKLPDFPEYTADSRDKKHTHDLGVGGWIGLATGIFVIFPLVFVAGALFLTAVGVIALVIAIVVVILILVRGREPIIDTSRRFKLVHRLTKPIKIRHWRIFATSDQEPVDTED